MYEKYYITDKEKITFDQNKTKLIMFVIIKINQGSITFKKKYYKLKGLKSNFISLNVLFQ